MKGVWHYHQNNQTRQLLLGQLDYLGGKWRNNHNGGLVRRKREFVERTLPRQPVMFIVMVKEIYKENFRDRMKKELKSRRLK